MKSYHFYVTNDKNKEAISYTKSNSLEEAIVYFAKIKQMPVNVFLNIFTVEG